VASTLTVYNAIAFVSPFIKQQRLNVNNMEPALGMANVVLQRMLGAPMVWRFNRYNTNLAITQGGGTEYSLSLPNLGRIETQWLVDGAGKIHQLKGAISIARVSTVRRPTSVAPQYDDNAGNITLRFNSIPDADYTANFDYQAKAPLLTSYGQPFGNVPDEFAYIFYTLFLAWAGILVNDARYPIWVREGVSALLGAQGGLDEQSKAIFVGDWMDWFQTIEGKKIRVNSDTTALQQ